jgi:hypothetical protein
VNLREKSVATPKSVYVIQALRIDQWNEQVTLALKHPVKVGCDYSPEIDAQNYLMQFRFSNVRRVKLRLEECSKLVWTRPLLVSLCNL